MANGESPDAQRPSLLHRFRRKLADLIAPTPTALQPEPRLAAVSDHGGPTEGDTPQEREYPTASGRFEPEAEPEDLHDIPDTQCAETSRQEDPTFIAPDTVTAQTAGEAANRTIEEDEFREQKRIRHAANAERISAQRQALVESKKKRIVVLQIADHAVSYARAKPLRDGEEEAIRKAVADKQLPLMGELRKSIIRDVYDNVIQDGRKAEALRFLRSMRLTTRNLGDRAAISIVLDEVARLAEENRNGGFDPESYPENGHLFEYWVASSLEKFGWTTRVTRGSGDQGVDVFATKDGLTVAIQAKRLSGVVGNAAVQEVFSGAALHGVRHAAVISTAKYTPGAIELAEATDVKLLHISDIPRLDEIFLRDH
ncbi:restriction endonuclease [Paracoccus litorisediminis]